MPPSFSLEGKVTFVTGASRESGSRSPLRSVLEGDLIGPFLMAKAVLPGMMEKRRGKILNVCSLMSELDAKLFPLTPPPRGATGC